MINLTANIMVLEPNKSIINQKIREALLWTRELLVKRDGDAPDKTRFLPKTLKKLGYQKYFTEKVINSLNFKSDFLTKILDYTETQNGNYNMVSEYGITNDNDIIAVQYLKKGIKIALLKLWKEKMILFPIWLTFENIPDEILGLFNNEITLKIKEKILIDDKIFSKRKFVVLQQILRSTNYHQINDFKFEEFTQLHCEYLKTRSGKETKLRISSKMQIMQFFNIFNKELKIEKYDAIKYKSWIAGFNSRYKELNYFDFLNEEENLVERRRLYFIEKTKNRKAKLNISKKDKIIEHRENVYNLNTDEKHKEIIQHFFNFCKNNPMVKFEEIKYPGFEHLYQKHDTKIWLSVFKDFKDYRKKNGYEVFKSQKYTINFLFHYIFFYLSIWFENNKESHFLMPTSPKDFKRFIFVNKTSLGKAENQPLTILEMLNLQSYNNSSKNTHIRALIDIFDYIAAYYEEEQSVWNDQSKNPFKKEDLLIETRGNKKTDKEIIPINVYPYFKKYCYGVENFGEFLQMKCLKNELSRNDAYGFDFWDTEKIGYVPYFSFRGKNYPIKKIPNIFVFHKRNFKNNLCFENFGYLSDGLIYKKYLPNLNSIRSFICTLNTGFRMAQTRWLDIDTWDMDNKNKSQRASYPIFINTDKAKTKPWQSIISHDVRESLLKQENFQKCMLEPFMSKEIVYQNREFSRFDKILPLFRSGYKTGLPISENAYHKDWQVLCYGFHLFGIENIDKNFKFIDLKKPHNLIVKKIGRGIEKTDYIEMDIKVVHTPHSMRASFCTHMSEFMDREEIARLVGHNSSLITSEVYIKPELSSIIGKVEKARNILDGVNANYFDKESLIHIKPEKASSALQNAFKENREETIELFRITSISMNVNLESEKQSEKSLRLLREARMDHILFENTHICPVGGQCPTEVMSIIGEKRRCGLCPLALKCVDNLNPIYAKQRDMIREIKNGNDKLHTLINKKSSEGIIKSIEDKLNLDIQELISWKFASEFLSNEYEYLKSNTEYVKKFHVEKPEMVSQFLHKVSVSSEKEYLLTRLADANNYVEYSSPENQHKADLLKREILRNLNQIDESDYVLSAEQRLDSFCVMIKNILESNKITLNQLVEHNIMKSIEDSKNNQPKIFDKKVFALTNLHKE